MVYKENCEVTFVKINAPVFITYSSRPSNQVHLIFYQGIEECV